MLLISTTYEPATDLGFLLHKNPARNYSADLTFGRVHVVFPEATSERTTAAVLLEIDPVYLVRGKKEAQGSVAEYVNDRPYVASSFLSVALIETFSTCIAGRSKDRPELAETPIPLVLRLPILPCRSGEERLRRLFEPLGYEVEAKSIPLDDQFPSWGQSRYYDVKLTVTARLRDALRHLYLLLPVLDAKKHYYMDKNEVDKLVQKGEGWLAEHPERDWIVKASLGRKPSLMRAALEQLTNIEAGLAVQDAEVDEVYVEPVEVDEVPRKKSLHQQRHDRIAELIQEQRPKTVVDFGCGDGKFIKQLIKIKGIERIVGMDVSYFEIEKATRKLNLEDAGPRMRERVQLFHGSLMYRDERLHGFEVGTVIEVIEHLDAPRLAAFEKVVFGHAIPKTVYLTTPNREYNAVYDLAELRHSDHRFEWTRPEFEAWAKRVAEMYGYSVRFERVGEAHPELGCPSQMAVFAK